MAEADLHPATGAQSWAFLGRLDAAAQNLLAALDDHPGHEENLDVLTSLLVRQDRVQDAVRVCRRVIGLGASSSFPYRLAAILCFNNRDDPQAAVAWLEEALAAHPGEAELHRLLASIGVQTLDRDRARRHGLAALALGDDRANLAILRGVLQDHEAALALGTRLLADDPNDLETLINCGLANHMLGRLEAAVGFYRRAAEQAPYRGDVLFPLADALLLLGDDQGGWRQFDRLGDDSQLASLHPTAAANLARFWRGQDLAGRRILVLNRVGLGDSLMYLRYARDLKAAGAHVTICCAPPLKRLFAGAEGVDVVCDAWPIDRLGDYDYWAFDILLPAQLGARERRIPGWTEGYLKGPPALAADLHQADDLARPLRVGLCWTTAATFYSGNTRLMWPEDLRPLAQTPNVLWFCLQKRARQDDFAELSGLDLIDFSDDWADFYDTARFAQTLDVTLSICSAPVHLCGALGLPVWAMIAKPPEWRWGLQGAQSPWYPQARIFRQTDRGDWQGVTSAIARALDLEREALKQASRARWRKAADLGSPHGP